MQRCAIYIRVSTAEQQMHGKSLQAQQDFLEEYAHTHQMSVAAVYADEGKTARKELRKRKAIHALLESVKQGNIDIILFWKMDRWFRNVSDFYKVQDILDLYGVKWIAVAEPNINMDTRDGRLNLNIMLSIGQNEVDTTSERIRFVNENSIRQGKVIFGNPSMPFGYKVAVIDNIKRMVKDEEYQSIVADTFDYYLRHQSKSATIRHMNQKYGSILTVSRIRSMCTNPMYAGIYRNNPNYCPAYITLEEYHQLQSIQKQNPHLRTPLKDNAVYLFSGLIKCPACGRIMTSNTRKKQLKATLKYYRYYRCPNHYATHTCTFSKSCGEETLERYLLSILTQQMNVYHLIIHSITPHQTARPVIDIDKIEKEIKRLNYMYLKGRISQQQYDQTCGELELRLRSSTDTDSNPPMQADLITAKMIANSWLSIYHHLNRRQQRCFWRSLLEKIEFAGNERFEQLFFRI